MNSIRVSVALAAFNGEKYIREQLDSILENLSKQDEIVASDDGSSDRTWDILKSYEGKDIPVRVIKGPGRGVKQNINAALKCCRGKYIFLADQDDVWVSGKVDRVLRYLGKDGCSLVCHDAKVMNDSLTEVLMPSFFAYRGSKPGFYQNLLKNRYMGCCMAFERELLSDALPIPEEIEMHDQWLGMINDKKGKGSVFLPEQLLFYRRHETNVSDFSHGSVPKMLRKRFALLRAIWERRKLRNF